MLPLVHSLNQDVQERNKQEKDNIATGKPICQRCNGKQTFKCLFHRRKPISAKNEDGPDDILIEHPFQEQFQEFFQGDVGLTHKIARDQYKAIDTNFTQQPNNNKKMDAGLVAPF